MEERYKFETNENGEGIMTDTKTGKVMRVADIIGDQSKDDATAMACAEAAGGDPRKRH